MNHVKTRMEKTLDRVKSNFTAFRSGRANPSLLSTLQVDYYGSAVPLQQVASISVPEPTMLQLNVFDQQAVPGVEKAITTSGLNLNPQTEGLVIRLRLPDLTEERRRELVKLASKEAEEGRVSIRNIRREEMDGLKAQEKNNEITEDDLKRDQHALQKLTDSYVALIDQLLKDKEADIMTV